MSTEKKREAGAPSAICVVVMLGGQIVRHTDDEDLKYALTKYKKTCCAMKW